MKGQKMPSKIELLQDLLECQGQIDVSQYTQQESVLMKDLEAERLVARRFCLTQRGKDYLKRVSESNG